MLIKAKPFRAFLGYLQNQNPPHTFLMSQLQSATPASSICTPKTPKARPPDKSSTPNHAANRETNPKTPVSKPSTARPQAPQTPSDVPPIPPFHPSWPSPSWSCFPGHCRHAPTFQAQDFVGVQFFVLSGDGVEGILMLDGAFGAAKSIRLL